MLFRSVELLFKKFAASNQKYQLSCSYVEVYNEGVYDLLVSKSTEKLTVRDDSREGVVIMGCTEVVITNSKDVQLIDHHIASWWSRFKLGWLIARLRPPKPTLAVVDRIPCSGWSSSRRMISGRPYSPRWVSWIWRGRSASPNPKPRGSSCRRRRRSTRASPRWGSAYCRSRRRTPIM